MKANLPRGARRGNKEEESECYAGYGKDEVSGSKTLVLNTGMSPVKIELQEYIELQAG